LTRVAQAVKTSRLDDVVDSVDSEQSRRHGNAASRDVTSSQYVIVHSGQASKVNGAMHPDVHTLPDHVPPEAYIFTSTRSTRRLSPRPVWSDRHSVPV